MKTKTGQFRTGLVASISVAHFVHDVFTAFLAPLLPLLIETLRISLFQAGSLAVAMQLPSVFNPVLGHLADRRRLHRLLVSVTPGMSGLLMCLIGIAPSYATLVVLLLATGFSVAGFHVVAPVLVGRLAGPFVGRGTGFFMFGGEIARTVGPLIAVQLVASFGLDGIWRAAPVAIASSIVLWWRLPSAAAYETAARPLPLAEAWRRMRRIVVAVGGVLVARAFMAAALTTFLPTFVYGRGESLWRANASLSLLELFGAAGALTMGALSDRLGRKRVLTGAVAISPPLMLLFLVSNGLVGFVVLALLGFVTLSTTPVLIAVILEHSGANAAAANGTFMMMNFAIRGLVILLVGAIGDELGLRGSYLICAALATIGIPFSLLLPGRK